jgi:alcohol dehydrogenase
VRLRFLVLPDVNPHDVGPIGQEFIGVVESVGDDVKDLAAGNLVIARFTDSDGTRAACW